ncbi:hypothetical protein BDV98DRAFT_628607 [Pterulicium gracile]|uniref:WD40-repeat-containing domain protein n=1 Tax=Pterulicium gracile TaxID=1884261 RepID=A0A5C3QJN7_9AGAR|nr:hypothetical protein BDV98DRAFT_628607 [Pterula gracilis]
MPFVQRLDGHHPNNGIPNLVEIASQRFSFPGVEIRGIAVDSHTVSSTTVILLGEVDPQRSNSTVTLRSGEKQIIVYHYANRQIQDIVPILEEVSTTQIGQNGREVLLGFKGKLLDGKCPPQLSQLDHKFDGVSRFPNKISLKLLYEAPPSTSFNGTASFSGNEALIMGLTISKHLQRASWNKSSNRDPNAPLTSVCWKPWLAAQSEHFSFASGSTDGLVTVWGTESQSRATTTLEQHQRSHQTQGSPVLTEVHSSESVLNGFPEISEMLQSTIRVNTDVN